MLQSWKDYSVWNFFVYERKMIMNTLQNLHTHTTYCDGKDTPEEMVLAAYQKGFDSIGFSGHASKTLNLSWTMTAEGTESYKQELASLKKKYADKINIYCGLEFDMYSKADLSGYDYLIGSVHCLSIGDEVIAFDDSAETTRSNVKKYYNGNGEAYAKAYYETLAKLPEYGSFDIIGHFDLVTKFCEMASFFDINSKAYRMAAVEAAEALAGKIPYFEVNTGAMARGYRTTPYPDFFLLKELKRLGFGAIISSDCHDSAYLDCGFKQARELLKECGFREQFILTKTGFVPVGL